MPNHVAKNGKWWRVVDPSGSPTKNASGTAVDGGGHTSKAGAQAQASAINISQAKPRSGLRPTGEMSSGQVYLPGRPDTPVVLPGE